MSEYPSEPSIRPPSPSRQVAFHQLLVGARKTWLIDALQEILGSVSAATVRRQLGQLVSDDVSALLASAGIRDEYIFPVPAILEIRPTLLGYYRLLLGASQKAFYRSDTGLARFKSMELTGSLNAWQKQRLNDLCTALCPALADLVRQLSPSVSPRDVNELPLLTLGSQFQGGRNVAIGQQATLEVFLGINEIVSDFIESRTEKRLLLRNASERIVAITLAGDPDLRIQEEFNSELRNKVAIEIKGGADVSNVHNRAGEAEKSHQKARNDGFRDFWTIILKRGVDIDKLTAESPTTNSWFDVSEVVGRQGRDWEDFRSRIAGEVGIPLTPP